jgi:ElaB/YqjD/DUF883 family membrane-anchored ribosome-binding protein
MDDRDESIPGKTGSSERSSTDIRNDIAARRESITQTVDQLGEKIHEALDWRGYVKRYPYASIGLAVGTGFVVSRIFKKQPSPMDRLVDAVSDRAERLGEDLRKSASRLIMKTVAPGLVRGTLYGIAGKALMQYLHNRAAHAEGNGANLSPETDWRDLHSTNPTSTPSNFS